jgi:tetratricopeptide (TPR) repeat protein
LIDNRLPADVRRQHPTAFAEFRGVSPEAVRYFLDAQEQYSLIMLGEGGDWNRYVQLLKKALEIDPAFAFAHTDLAWAYMMRFGGTLPIEEASRGAHAEIDKAIALNADPGSSLLMLAQINLNLDLNYAAAEKVIQRGIELSAGRGWWYALLSVIATREGRDAEAARYAAAASAQDYGGEQANFLLGFAEANLLQGQYDLAIERSGKALALASGGAQRARALIVQATGLVMLDRASEAKPLIAQAWQLDGAAHPENFAFLYAKTGETARARQILADAKDSEAQFAIAAGYLALGEIDRVFAALRAGIEERRGAVIDSVGRGELFDQIRGDPRFDELIRLLESKVTHTAQYLLDHPGGV